MNQSDILNSPSNHTTMNISIFVNQISKVFKDEKYIKYSLDEIYITHIINMLNLQIL